MPVAARFTRHYPFLLESDTLSLSRDFALQESGLVDIPLGVLHQVREQGSMLLLAMLNSTTYRNLAELADRKHVSGAQLCELLGFLNSIGALQRRRSAHAHCKAALAQCTQLVFGNRYAPMSWRQAPTGPAIAKGVIRATWPVLAAITIVGTLAAGGGLLPADTAFGIGAWGFGVFAGSLIMHEAVHVGIAKHNRGGPRLLQIGLRLGVIHRTLPPRTEIISALAGPLAGGTVCALAAAILYMAGTTVFALPCAVAALFHGSSLLPWYGDGASLYTALRKKQLEPYV